MPIPSRPSPSSLAANGGGGGGRVSDHHYANSMSHYHPHQLHNVASLPLLQQQQHYNSYNGGSSGSVASSSTPSASAASLAIASSQQDVRCGQASTAGAGQVPLPSGWDVGQDFDGKVYFIDHINKKTTWVDPRESYGNQASEAEYLQQQQQQLLGDYCNLQARPQEQFQHQQDVSMVPQQQQQQHQEQYHQTRLYQQQQQQKDMLEQYLATAESDFRAKKERADIKQQQLELAQDEYQLAVTTLQQAMSASSTSCNGSPNLRTNTSSPASSASSAPSPAALRMRTPHHQQPLPPSRRHSSANSSFSEGVIQTNFIRQPSSADASPTIGNFGRGSANSSSNNSASSFSASQTSLNSTGSAASGSVASSSKYDLDLIKYEVHHARARVHRLKRELADIDQEMGYKQRGLDTLAQVSAKYSPPPSSNQQQPQQQQQQQQQHPQLLTLEEAQAIKAELLNIQRSLSSGEQEKQELMRSLACLKDDLIRLQHSESSLDVTSALNNMEKFSTASQTDLSGEMVPVGTRLAEMARLRLQYDEARRYVQDIQQSLASMEERMSPGQLESDKDRLLLIQDKEQLLRELRAITPRSRSSQEMSEVRAKIQRLQRDLDNATEVSNKCISERIRLQEEKQQLLQKLRDGMRTVSRLETQLKQLSATTLSSTSSSSSLGSLSSSHASSKGSLSSLSFTDIYGLSTTNVADPSMLDLHRRVDKILNPGNQQQQQQQQPNSGQPSPTAVPMLHHPLQMLPESGLQSAEESLTTPDSETNPNVLPIAGHSQPSLSPRSSLSSVSPPVSPQQLQQQQQQLQQHETPTMPPPYEHAYVGSVERQRRIQQCLVETNQIVHQLQELGLSKNSLGGKSKLSTITEATGARPNEAVGQEVEQILNQQFGGALAVSTTAVEPSLSPICEVESLPPQADNGNATAGSSNIVVASSSLSAAEAAAAVSDESVAGDSGVYEAVTRSNPSARGGGGSASSSAESSPVETSAQVQIKLRYSRDDSVLHIGVEKARNLGALFIPENRKICIKASLLPHTGLPASAWTFCTRSVSNLQKPSFGEHFPLTVDKKTLSSKTLQVTIWAVKPSDEEALEVREECLGSSQVSLADFDCDAAASVVRWFNVLSFRFMQQPGERSLKGSHRSRSATSSPRQRLHQARSGSESAASSKQGTLKEESSDESTVISSQASTLTRDNAGGGHEAALVAAAMIGELQESDEEEEEDEEDEENDDDVVIPTLPEVMDSLEAISSRDKETNTECVFVVPSGAPWNAGVASTTPMRRPGSAAGGSPSAPPVAPSALVRRSQTFSPAGLNSKDDYVCKLNRSDSDSAMSLHKRVAFQKGILERRSLRVPKANALKVAPTAALPSVRPKSHSSKSKKKKGQSSQLSSPQTPLDLELDLAAQQTKLLLLQEEIDRLKVIKAKMEEAKEKGTKEMPTWIQEHDKFQQMLTKAQIESQDTSPSAEEKKIEKMLRKTSRDIYRLRKTRTAAKGQPDALAFKEKMAFLANVKNDVPLPLEDDELEEGSSTLKYEDEEKVARVTVTHMEDNAKVVTLGSSSTETVDTITAEEEDGKHRRKRSRDKGAKEKRSKSSSSVGDASRFSYEIDPDIGVIV